MNSNMLLLWALGQFVPNKAVAQDVLYGLERIKWFLFSSVKQITKALTLFFFSF